MNHPNQAIVATEGAEMDDVQLAQPKQMSLEQLLLQMMEKMDR